MNQNQNEKQHNIVYKTTNLVNEKYYYGIHSTNRLNDGYLGSGHVLKQAIEKYGKENFNKEIIADYPTRKEASDHEKLIVTMELVLDETCYNLRTGGDNEGVYLVRPRSPEYCARVKEYMSGPNNPNLGRKHKLETKIKMSVWQKGIPKSEKTRKLCSISAKTPERVQLSLLKLKKATEYNFVECIIEGMFFGNIKLATEYFNMTRDMIVTRLRSERDEWKNWNYFKLEDYI